jgi:DNA-binding transcriptional LysR family regulator
VLETDELRIFVTVVALSSVSRAAAELRIPRATVSRKLAQLEARLGVRLIRRTTRSMQHTDQGREFHRHAETVLDSLRLAEASVRPKGAAPSGDVFVSMPALVGGGFPDVLANFVHEHPSIRLHVQVANRPVDLVNERFDVAIRASGALDEGLTARVLARTALVAVAAPAYAARHGLPSDLDALGAHRCLLALDAEGRPLAHWIAGRKRVPVTGVAHSNDPHLLLRWTLRSLGIAMLPTTLVATLLARGELVPVLPTVLRVEGAISLVMKDAKLIPPAVRTFVSYIAKHGPAALRHAHAADAAHDRAGKRASSSVS